MKKNFFRQKFTSFVFRWDGGFTLIELIVTVTVIMVLVGVGAMSLNSFTGVKELESVATEVSNHIKLARNLAITKQLPGGFIGLDYVKVSFLGNIITISGVAGEKEYTEASPYSSMKVKSGIGVSSSSDFGFSKSTGRLVDNSGEPTTMSVVVSVTSNGGTKIININNSGVISNEN